LCGTQLTADAHPLLRTWCTAAVMATWAAQVFNIVGLAVEHYPHSEAFAAVLSISNSVFLCICAP
jgi:hypothetical protein